MSRFNKEFCTETFILASKYETRRQNVCKLSNFIQGEAKMGIYDSRKKQIKAGHKVSLLFAAPVKALAVWIYLQFYILMWDLEAFEVMWRSYQQ